MKEENEIDFISLLEDESFVKMVRDTFDLQDQIAFIEREYPKYRAELITFAVDFIKANVSEQKRMSAEDADQILQNIINHTKIKKGTEIRHFVFNHFWKAAAVIVLVVGSSVLYYRYQAKDPLKSFALQETAVQDEAVLILSDGSRHKIDEDDSKIEYSNTGNEVVVRNKREKDQKLANQQDSKEPVINQIIVPFGHRHSVTLSDGTQVDLNSGSKLVFPAEFSGKTREVYLIGEGFFDVRKNEKVPFIVKTDHINIQVLGTRFNISAYADENVTSAVLAEGSITIFQTNKIIKNTLTKLVPGQGCFYSSATSTSIVKQVDLADYISWKDGLFRFKDQPLINVVQRVRKYYNKNITIEGDKLSSTLISGKLVLTDDITSTMNYLAKTLEARYEVTTKGTYVIKQE
jgi:transmembrane sensor